MQDINIKIIKDRIANLEATHGHPYAKAVEVMAKNMVLMKMIRHATYQHKHADLIANAVLTTAAHTMDTLVSLAGIEEHKKDIENDAFKLACTIDDAAGEISAAMGKAMHATRYGPSSSAQ